MKLPRIALLALAAPLAAVGCGAQTTQADQAALFHSTISAVFGPNASTDEITAAGARACALLATEDPAHIRYTISTGSAQDQTNTKFVLRAAGRTICSQYRATAQKV